MGRRDESRRGWGGGDETVTIGLEHVWISCSLRSLALACNSSSTGEEMEVLTPARHAAVLLPSVNGRTNQRGMNGMYTC